MKKIAVITLVAILIVIFMSLLIGNILNSTRQELEKEVIKIESNLGKKLFIDGDSLTIIDYSLLNETYNLSNGKSVSFKLVEKLKTK